MKGNDIVNYIVIIGLVVILGLLIYSIFIRKPCCDCNKSVTQGLAGTYTSCDQYKSSSGCTKSKLGCKWTGSSCTSDGGPTPPPPGPGPTPSPGSTNCKSPGGKIQARDMNGNPVDWWLIIKYPKDLLSGETNCNCGTCTGTSKPGSSEGACYFYADSNDSTLKWFGNGNCINTCDNALSKTISQATSGTSYGTWNDQPEHSSTCSAPKAHSKGMVCYDSSGGFVLNATTPHFPVDQVPPGSSPAGCQNDDNLKAAQQFFCMSLDMDNLKTWGKAAENAQLCGRDQWGVGLILSKSGNSHGKSMTNVELQTMGGTKILMTVKAGDDYYNPWSLVSAAIGMPMQVASWTAAKDGTGTSDWGTAPCYSGSKGLKQVVTIGDSTHGVFNATYGTTHAKFGISTSPNWVTFGSMNQQNSQGKRGGDFYSMQNTTLWNTLNQWINNGSTRNPTGCGIK